MRHSSFIRSAYRKIGSRVADGLRRCEPASGRVKPGHVREPVSRPVPDDLAGADLEAGDLAGARVPCGPEDLRCDYWYPRYARPSASSTPRRRDLVQGLFVSLLEPRRLEAWSRPAVPLAPMVPVRCTATRSGITSARAGRRAAAAGRVAIPIDALTAESRLRSSRGHDLTAERLFELPVGTTLLDHVMHGLDAEMARSDKRALYERLRPALLGHEETPPSQVLAGELDPTAAKMAAHRLRGPLPRAAQRGDRPHDRRPVRDR